MAIMTRLARLPRADLNAFLARLEAPELVLAQAGARHGASPTSDFSALTSARGFDHD